MKSKELELVMQLAELFIERDPELKALREKFMTFGCTPPESIGAVIGRICSPPTPAARARKS